MNDERIKAPRLLDENYQDADTVYPHALAMTYNLDSDNIANMQFAAQEKRPPARGFVRIFTADGDEGVYRVSGKSRVAGVNERVVCRHAFCTLDDNAIPGEHVYTGTLSEILTELIALQDQQQRHWVLGSVAATDRITVENDSKRLGELIREAVKGCGNVRLTFDMAQHPWTLGAEIIGDDEYCEGSFSRNMTGCSIDLDDSELCTRVYLDESEIVVERKEKLDEDGKWTGLYEDVVAQLPSYYQADDEHIAKYGIISNVVTVPDGATPESVQEYAESYIAAHQDMHTSIELGVDDLSAETGEEIDRFRVGYVCFARLPDEDIEVRERIISISVPDAYGEPRQKRVVMSNTRPTLASFVVETESGIESVRTSGIKTQKAVTRNSRNIIESGEFIKFTSTSVKGLQASLTMADGSFMADAAKQIALRLRESDLDSKVTGFLGLYKVTDKDGNEKTFAEMLGDVVIIDGKVNKMYGVFDFKSDGTVISAKQVDAEGMRVTNLLNVDETAEFQVRGEKFTPKNVTYVESVEQPSKKRTFLCV